MSILHGRNLVLSLGGTAVAASKECSLSVSADTLETASATQGSWRSYIAGRKDWKISATHFITSSNDINTSVLRVGSSYSVTLTDGAGHTLSGTAICTQCDIGGSVGDLVSGTFTLQGSGALTGTTSTS